MKRSITSVRRAMKSRPVLLNHVSAETGLPQSVPHYAADLYGTSVVSHKYLHAPFVVSLSSHERNLLIYFTLRQAQGERIVSTNL